ncbi:S1C family serine protease [Microbulbifer thermotolerans]|uniref:Serine protease n=1 Tax=Microbulbifer thermotolerans TaxID=252514 RepID=A0AB35HUZ5_MICTH|nr:serine protease [Microbulbifer thermotolerans]MCX2801025.1 serine protease [Microbulbifer thermotolerans]MCX2831584.1 serine protease [Microbulbifer thermotolerans]MCX2841671.1 serine protease [Microbulbifer thermotolerans]
MLNLPVRLLGVLLYCFCSFAFSSPASAQSYEKLYSDYRDSLYQIRLIEKSSNSKTGLGSGFQISPDGLIATNYHVVAEAVRDPDKYQLEYLSVDGTKGKLTLLDIDVINDLALLQQDKPGPDHLLLAEDTPKKGETIISLGNPLDLGMTLIPGTYNGIASGSFYDRIHFAGSINPGMSGGPAINTRGRVVGINVATAGNQVSFLVPVEKLAALLKHFRTQNNKLDLKQVTYQQLLANQRRIIDAVLKAEWSKRSLGEAKVVGEIVPAIQCWGNTLEDDDNPVKRIDKGCTGQDVVFLADDFNTGRVEYEFFWLEADDKLLPSRFYAEYEAQMSSFYPGNSAGEDDVTNFRCKQAFTSQARDGEASPSKPAHNKMEPTIARTSYCVRRYKDFPDLYDIFFLSLSVDQKNRALVSHFTLSGFTRESAAAFTEKFTSEIQWH